MNSQAPPAQAERTDRIPPRPARRAPWVFAYLVIACVCLAGYCFGTIPLTGQACMDFVSGHVPPRAEQRFLDELFSAAVENDQAWLATRSGVLPAAHDESL